MTDSVVVTLNNGRYENDFELPWYLPLGKLYPKVLTVLKSLKPTVFSNYNTVVFCVDGKGLLAKDKCLADYGICTGDYLFVAKEDDYYG